MCDVDPGNPYSPHGRLLEISTGRRVFKTKLFKGKYEAKLGFPEGGVGGSNQKVIRAGSMNTFWKNKIIVLAQYFCFHDMFNNVSHNYFFSITSRLEISF